MSNEENGSGNKRTRASGEVLEFLLQEFEHNQNPNPGQRKEISDKTNMTEKAVRIWFQNRRAKVRKSERLGRSTAIGSMNSSRSNSLNRNDNIHNNRHHYQSRIFNINDKYCFIDCSSLSVGSWQRVKSGYHDETLLREGLINLSPFTLVNVMQNVDLLVIVSKKDLEINYFFIAMQDDSKILFRIFYPLTNIMTCSLLDNNIDKESNELRVSLSHRPKFSINFFNGINSSTNQWSICDDFSEGQQVSSAHDENGATIPHVLVGSKSSICFLNDFILEKNQQHQRDYMLHDTAHILSDNNKLSNFNTQNGIVNDDDDNDDMNDDENEPEFNNHKLNNNIDNEDGGNFQYNSQNASESLAWNESEEIRANGLSPLGQFGSDTSPTSLNSDKNTQDKRGGHHNELQSHLHYNEVFTADTPDFFNSSQNPNMDQSDTPKHFSNADVHHSNPITNSPFPSLQTQEIFEGGPNEQPFDFPVVSEYSGLDNSPPKSDHLDRFIDYNDDYP